MVLAEKQSLAAEEERRKITAKKKLLELEAQIANRQAQKENQIPHNRIKVSCPDWCKLKKMDRKPYSLWKRSHVQRWKSMVYINKQVHPNSWWENHQPSLSRAKVAKASIISAEIVPFIKKRKVPWKKQKETYILKVLSLQRKRRLKEEDMIKGTTTNSTSKHITKGTRLLRMEATPIGKPQIINLMGEDYQQGGGALAVEQHFNKEGYQEKTSRRQGMRYGGTRERMVDTGTKITPCEDEDLWEHIGTRHKWPNLCYEVVANLQEGVTCYDPKGHNMKYK